MIISVFDRVEKIVGKGKIARTSLDFDQSNKSSFSNDSKHIYKYSDNIFHNVTSVLIVLKVFIIHFTRYVTPYALLKMLIVTEPLFIFAKSMYFSLCNK